MANVKVNEDFYSDIKKVAADRHMSIKQVSKWIGGLSDTYLSTCLSKDNPSIPDEAFKRLIEWMGEGKEEDYIQKTVVVKPKEKPKSTVDAGEFVVGITSLYNKVNELLTEQKNTNTILREMLGFIKTTNNYSKATSEYAEAMKSVLYAANSDIHKSREQLAAISTQLKFGGRV